MQRIEQVTYRIPLDGQWRVISNAWLREKETSSPREYAEWDHYIAEGQKNPLSLFLAHGRKRSEGTNDGLAVVNDWEHDLIAVTAPLQTGKSYLGAAYCLFRSIPCAPDWPCFVQHGVQYREWAGPKILVVASYSWDNVSVVWEVYRSLLPRRELGPYAPMWGAFPGEKGKAREVAFNNFTKVIRLQGGTQIVLLCYTQSLVHFQTRQCDIAHADEQPPEAHFDGLSDRQQARGDYTPIIVTATPYILPERPHDTGAQGWLVKKILQGTATKGRKVAHYRIGMEDVPDCIVSAEKKRTSYIRNVKEPEELHDEKRVRAGRAAYYGEPEVGGGLVLSEWNDDLHFIEPFDVRSHSPSYYRMIDHGNEPCAALLFAVFPWGDAVAFAEYYEFGKTIGPNAIAIVEELSKNRRVKVDEFEERGQIWPIYNEVYTTHYFVTSELDGRSFHTRSTETIRPIGALYRQFGLTVTAASMNKNLVDLLHQWLALEKGRPHINHRLGRKYRTDLAAYGSPRLYAFSTLRNFRSEISNWAINPRTDRPVDGDDHLMSCLLFFAARDRPYLGYNPGAEEGVQRVRSDYTNY